MAKNVSYQRSLDNKSADINYSNSVQNPTKSRHQNVNSFDCDYSIYCTERYSEITPFYVANGVPRDVNPLINAHELRTYTLQAPLMSDVYKHKNYFQIPMKAILPRTWDLFYRNPVQGDDVPEDVYCSWDIITFARTMIVNLSTSYSNANNPIETSNLLPWLCHFLRQSTFLESIFSTGSLLSYLGFPASSLFLNTKSSSSVKNFDDFMDQVVSKVLNDFIPIELVSDGRYYTLDINPIENASNTTPVNIHRFMEIVRENPRFTIRFSTGSTIPEDFLSHVNSELIPLIADGYVSLADSLANYAAVPIDISRLIAYQLVCAHFYSDDSIDFIYSADLFRKNAESFYRYATAINHSETSLKNVALPSFAYNGTYIQYDIFSRAVYVKMSDELQKSTVLPSSSSTEALKDEYVFLWFSLLLQFRHSLKHGDYFTGSKPFPLAVGDVNAPVVNGSVSAIDMTVNISKQRFLNAVNRFGASVDDYIKGIYGTDLPPVDDEPKWLANESFKIFGTEIENTGSEQREDNSITTILKSNGGKFAFEAFCDVPCIFLGLSWYSVKRAYISSAERFFFHKNRFDMFNPYLQYIGDQEIYSREISVANNSTTPFSYTGRFMEYKQRFDRAVGGFANSSLPNWSSSVSLQEDMDSSHNLTISPDFIRSKSYEFDRYYSSLSNISLGTYFHFIVKYTNFNSIKRAMDYSPSIL